MDNLPHRTRPASWLLAGLLLYGTCRQGDLVLAQTATTKKDPSSTSANGQARGDGAAAGADSNTRRVAGNEPGKTQAPAKAVEPRREPSAAYKESLRKTLEKRRQRRAQRAQAQGVVDPQPIGAIVLWPMPPALIVRHTPEVHGEVSSLLGQIQRSGH